MSKHLGVEFATEAGHMRVFLKGVRSTTKSSNRGRLKYVKETEKEMEDRKIAMEDSTTEPVKEPGNAKTNLVFMTVKLADNWIASDQTGAFPRTSFKGNKYISIFYVFDRNFIKGVPIKSTNK